MNLCACIGPVGDCPCIRRERGLPQHRYESYLNPSSVVYATEEQIERLFYLIYRPIRFLSDEEFNEETNLKLSIALQSMFDKKKISLDESYIEKYKSLCEKREWKDKNLKSISEYFDGLSPERKEKINALKEKYKLRKESAE